MYSVEGFNLEKNASDNAMEFDELREEANNDQVEESISQETNVLGMIVGEKTAKDITENPEFLLNPAKMTTQGQLIFYMNVVVASLIVLSAILGNKFNLGIVLLVLNIIIMAFLHSNVINCMIVGNCNVYSTILTSINVIGQVLLISTFIYMLMTT